MILVIGASGMLGMELCQQLRAKFHHVKAMVRHSTNPQKKNELNEIGCQLVEGDLRNPATFRDVLKGVSVIISTVSSMPFAYTAGENDIQNVDLEGMRNFIDEAKTQGIKRFIYTSFSGNLDLDFPIRNAKREIEKHLSESGIIYTILRPSAFTEVWLSAAVGFDVENGKVQVYGEGTAPISYISYKDVATIAITCLRNPSTRNAVLELGGPEAISQLEAVKIFEKATARKFEIHNAPTEMLEKQMHSAPDAMQQSFSGLMLCLANGDSIDMKEFQEKFQVKLLSVKDYAKHFEPVH